MPSKETEAPKRQTLLRDNEEPREVNETTDSAAPRRAKLRSANDEPRYALSKTET